MEFALAHGAQKARVTLNKSLMELFGMLNGELDKVTHALDRSLQVALFVDGRFGSFSSNRLEEEGLKAFLLDAIETDHKKIAVLGDVTGMADLSEEMHGVIGDIVIKHGYDFFAPFRFKADNIWVTSSGVFSLMSSLWNSTRRVKMP